MKAYKPFAVTVIGGSHIKHGKGCEDHSDYYDDPGMSIAVVADGHGDDNCFRSAKGSELAVKCALEGIKEFVEFHESEFSSGFFKKKTTPAKDIFDKAIRDIIKRIIALWQVRVEEDYTAHPFTAEELEKADEKHRKMFEEGIRMSKAYGTTLIATAITPGYWLGIHIGDGRFTALYADGTFDQPVPWDERCNLNITTSMCDDDAFERARHYFSFHEEKAPPAAVFLCSDGVDDSLQVFENEKHLYKLYCRITLTFAENESTYEKKLNDWANKFAIKGKGDDTSIAGFINTGAMEQAVPIWKKQIAEEEAVAKKAAAEKAAIEEAAKEEAPVVTKAEAEKPDTTVLRNAAAEYQKNMDFAKGGISSYGDMEKAHE